MYTIFARTGVNELNNYNEIPFEKQLNFVRFFRE